MKDAWRKWLAEIAQRITHRSDSTSVLVLVECTLPFLLLLMGLHLYAAQDPALSRLYDARWLWPSLWAQAALIVWLTLLGTIALRLRKDARRRPWLVQMAIFPAGVGVLLLSMGFGLKDTPMCTIALGEFVFLRSLFPTRKLKGVMLASLLILLGNEWATHTGRLPYAPLLAAPIYQGEGMHGWWALWTRILYLCAAYPVAGWFLLMSATMHRNRVALARIARTDPLTGVANRREFMAQLTQLTQTAQAAQSPSGPAQPMAIVMLDVDHFKHINDRHGHAAGDEVLACIGRILRTHTRAGVDLAARFGGEEFVLLLPGLSAHDAGRLAQRILDGLRKEAFVSGGQGFEVTLSAGTAQVQGQDIGAALKQADDNLYRAKAAGRNQIVMPGHGARSHGPSEHVTAHPPA
ncbi:MAG: GGDEF domain-containing protein [Aquabacterium sp.]